MTETKSCEHDWAELFGQLPECFVFDCLECGSWWNEEAKEWKE